MKILFIGDIVGSPGREAVKKLIPEINREYGIDFVIANAENAAGGSGITARISAELFDAGVAVITAGDHIWKKSDVFEIIDRDPRILRPVNFPAGAPGAGVGVFEAARGVKVAVINVLGRVFIDALLDCPFKASRQAAEAALKETPIIIVDVHAEATSEKIALGWYLEDICSAVLGTHTHIQTADEKILPKGCAYVTDVGMTGPYASVIGRRVEDVLKRFLTSIPTRFEVATDDVQLHGAVVDVDEKTGRARSIVRIQKKLTG
jgi:2',3'-cyclic-nucleotide 2'-phosphodiesterase